VPSEFSVVGFDDNPEAGRGEPTLTTIRQPLVEMGSAATRQLLSMLNGEEGLARDVLPRTHLFVPELVVRNSTGPLTEQMK
jgi:LacI family transcriptional regulator